MGNKGSKKKKVVKEPKLSDRFASIGSAAEFLSEKNMLSDCYGRRGSILVD
jgi:hypothetical protein